MATSFEELLRDNMNRITRIAQRHADVGQVEDLIQDISLALWRSYKRFRGEPSVETWVYRVAFNTAMKRVRGHIRARSADAAVLVGQPDKEPGAEGLSQADILSDFMSSVNSISERISAALRPLAADTFWICQMSAWPYLSASMFCSRALASPDSRSCWAI